MDLIKWILVAIGLLAVVVIGYWVIGIISGLFWLAVYAGIIGLIGYGGYRLFFGGAAETKELEEGRPIAISEIENTDRALEEYRQKYLK
jgi:hypothetical protein